MKNVLVVVSVGMLVAASLLGACSDGFTSCIETHTCQHKSDAGAASSVGGAHDTGGFNGEALAGSDATSGRDATTGDDESSGGGENGGAPILGRGGATADAECSAADTRCTDNLVQTCGANNRFGEPEPCPADAPICHAGACKVAPSCSGLIGKCGISSSENCCTSPLVAGGTFDRKNDLHHVETVDGFRLDKYEVTVGRFRKFVNATLAGWTPPSEAGKHEHLNDGKGLANGDGTTFEAGWQPEWTAMLPATKADWSTVLNCSASYQTWSPIAGANENLPINCVGALSAYAFCIWDGGFLPSATEHNYASAGGDEQRIYPWGDEIPGNDADLAAYDCYFGGGSGTCTDKSSIPAVGSITAGAGRWGQLDLGGSVFEWTVVWSGGSIEYLQTGGSFTNHSGYMLVAGFTGYSQTLKPHETGLRCARMP